jgi:hypothetical protein
MPADIRVISNHQQVIKTIDDLKAKIGNPLAVVIHVWAAERVVQEARDLAHIGPDPTYPRGRPHTVETIRLQPLNQFATRVLANYGAPWEEARGGDHAFLTRAVERVEPEALVHFEQMGLDVVHSLGW